MLQFLSYTILFLLGVLLPHWVLRWDEARLPPRQLERAWNKASHWSAVAAFSVLCLPVHFVRTRRTIWGLLTGLVWSVACLVVHAGVALLLEALLGALS